MDERNLLALALIKALNTTIPAAGVVVSTTLSTTNTGTGKGPLVRVEILPAAGFDGSLFDGTVTINLSVV